MLQRTHSLVQRTTKIGERSTMKPDVVVLCFEDEQDEGCTRAGRWVATRGRGITKDCDISNQYLINGLS